VATRKISDLTLLTADQVSSSDTLLLLDNSDPTDQNKRSAVGSIFTAVPSGSYTAPGVRFEGKTATGLFSTQQGQVGLAMGNARLNLQKVGTTLNIEARDDVDQNLDFTISAQGTGKIRLGSILAVNDLNFVIPNSSDETKVARFSSANLTSGITNIYSFPNNVGMENTTDELVTLKATQTLENKTLISPVLTGTLSMEAFTTSGNVTIGDAASDSMTVNAASVFAASATFSNSMIANQGFTLTGDMIMNSHIDMVDDKAIKMGTDDDFSFNYANVTDTSYITSTASQLFVSSDVVELNASNHTTKYFKASSTESVIYHNDAARITTSATGINIGGAIDAVTSITGSGDVAIATDKFTLDSATGNAVFGGTITCAGNIQTTVGTAFQLGSTASAKLGIGRAASTYNLEVEGSIYSTGSTIIAGNGTAGKFIIQKGVGGIGLHFTDSTGTDQAVLSSGGNFGIAKSPTFRLDVSGNSNIDGDLTLTTTNPAAGVGGKLNAREIILTDPQTLTTTTLTAATATGVSRGRVFFLAN
jgi:hypothetical protein